MPIESHYDPASEEVVDSKIKADVARAARTSVIDVRILCVQHLSLRFTDKTGLLNGIICTTKLRPAISA